MIASGIGHNHANSFFLQMWFVVNIPHASVLFLGNIAQALFFLQTVSKVVAGHAEEAGRLRNISTCLVDGSID